MVLLLAPETTTAAGEGRKRVERRDQTYCFEPNVLHSSRPVAVAYDSAVLEETPAAEEVTEALLTLEHHYAAHPSFFVTPYDGLLESNEEVGGNTSGTLAAPVPSITSSSPPQAPWHRLLEAITECVNRRENVTVVHRGVRCEDYLATVLLALTQAIAGPAEYAMQVVADEIAKEKQMQRLLQLDAEEEAHHYHGGYPRHGGRSDSARDSVMGSRDGTTGRNGKGLPLSQKLVQRLRRLRQTYPYTEPIDQGSGTRRAYANGEEGGERFTLLSAAHDAELSPPCKGLEATALQPSSSTTAGRPLFHRTAGSIANAGPTRERNTRSHSYLYRMRQRRSTALMMNELQGDTEETLQEPLRGNGWGSTVSFFTFDGHSSVLAVPGVPHFEDLVRSFSVDFWLRTDCTATEGKRVLVHIMEGQRDSAGQLFQISLNWYEEMPESLRVFCRDSANRVVEALIPVKETGLTQGRRFFHVMLHVRNLDEGVLECLIDGKPMAVQLMQQEHPAAFNTWPHRLFLGGYLDENNAAEMVLRGALLDVRFWNGAEPPKPVIRWPLLADHDTLTEVTKTIPTDHHETLLNLHRVEEPVPHNCPHFDGNLVANLGCMALWGELMHNWRLEIRFRTDVSTRVMTLIGATDEKYKMQEFGIVLNAEPEFSKERFRFHEFNVTLYLVDAFGSACSALLRGTERETLMDGEWHTIVWKCVDSESNKFSVKVDGVKQDLLYVYREGPSRFVPWDDWVCLGGHNVRNWKVVRPFVGEISHCFVSLRGVPYATLRMNEGPGAIVMQDTSGHRNHGLLVSPETSVVRKHDIVWVAVPLSASAEDDDVAQGEVVVFQHNRVAVAAVVFTCAFTEDGFPQEVLYDVLRRAQCRDLAVVDHHISDARPQWKTWRAIPEECFRALDTVVQLHESVDEVLKARPPRGHLMVVVRIGDCYITLLHVQDPELPLGATYNTNMLKWHYPYAVEGIQGRQELALHRMIEGMESVLLRDTLTPFTTARLGPLNATAANAVVSEDIIAALQRSGKPWYLASVLHHQLLNAEYGSHLHIIHRVYPTMTADEAAAVCLFNKCLHDTSRDKAALVVQRNWRGRLAKAEAARRATARAERERKLEEIRTFRMNPVVQAKPQLYALLITLHEVRSPQLAPIEFSLDELEDVLQRQGYEVERLVNPDRAALMKAVAQVDVDKSSFIYVSGYGGAMGIRQPPLLGLQSLHIHISEGAERAALEYDASHTLRTLRRQMERELAALPPPKKSGKKKSSKANSSRSAAPRSKAAIEAEQLAEQQRQAVLTAALLELEQEESYVRDGLVKSLDTSVHALAREIRQAILTTKEYESQYRHPPTTTTATTNAAGALASLGHQSTSGGGGRPDIGGRAPPGGEATASYYLYPCEANYVEPYASTVIDVEDFIRTALRRQMPPVGLQCVLAIDLQPVVPGGCGIGCLASSTGNTFRMPYQPEQRHLLTWLLKKAFDGHLPMVASSSKYAVLSGGIETRPEQRDWKSLASYVVSKMQPVCTPACYRALRAELDRELPFTAELIPVRSIVLTSDAKDRLRRDREAEKVTAKVYFGVGSTKVQSDMFAVLKVPLDGLPLSELTFLNTVYVVFAQHNRGIDGLDTAHLKEEVEKCRPVGCVMEMAVQVTAQGAAVSFTPQDPTRDKLFMTQWIGSIVVRSLSWQLRINPLCGYGKLEVDYVEYLYAVKTSCHMRRYRQLVKEWYTKPVSQPYVRLLRCEVIKSKS